jgi:hypothetical protein
MDTFGQGTTPYATEFSMIYSQRQCKLRSKSVEVPSFDELMWPMLQALKAMGGSATNEELLAKIIELEGYPPDIQAFQHSDNRQTKLNYNLAWAKTYLKKVGRWRTAAGGSGRSRKLASS